MKIHYDWSLERYAGVLSRCSGAEIDISEPFTERAAVLALTDLNVPWTSTRPMMVAITGGKQIATPPISSVDCLLTDKLERTGPRLTFWMFKP